jgi:peptide/nickel transport system substrate-binding protein
MPRQRKAITSLILTALLITLCGCGGEKADRPTGGGKLVIGMQQEPEILNEAVNSMVAIVYVCNLVFSKFVKHDDTMQLIPDLITEIPTLENGGISADYLVYTYHLRQDATWHDGTPVTSKDVEFSYRVMIHPDINVETRQGWDIVESVETPDPYTVIFKLSEVYANFAGDCFYDESVLPEHLLAGALGAGFQSDPFHSAPVGSGPFIFHEWVSGSHMTFRKNPGYYGEGPFLDEITIKFVPDGNALLMQLETGSVMGIDNAPDELLTLSDDLKGTTVYRNPALFNEHLDVNCENPILSDKRVRRAIAIAINRSEISEKIYNGVWIPAFSDEHPDSPYHSDYGISTLRYDPQEAMELLDEAGWKDTDGDGIRERGGQRLEMKITSTAGRASRERTQVVLQKQLSSVGIDLKIKNYHPTVMFASWDDRGVLKRGEFDLALYAFLTPPDPSTKEGSYSSDFFPPRGQNNSRFSHDELTRLLSKGSATVGFTERKKIYDEVARILAEELPVIPLLWVTQLDAMPAALENYRPNPTQSGDTWNAAQWRLPGNPGATR